MKKLGVLLGLGAGVAAGVRFFRKKGGTDAVADRLSNRLKPQAQKAADRLKGRFSDVRRDQEIDVTSPAPYATESTTDVPATVLTETESTPGAPTSPPVSHP